MLSITSSILCRNNFLKLTEFLLCFRTQITRNLNLNSCIHITMNRRILHGNNAFATESDLAARLNTGRNLAFHTALQSIHNGLTAKNSSCKRNRNCCINIHAFPLISRLLIYVDLQKQIACFAAIPGFDHTSALMVGDSLTSDIRGGRNAGLRTCWFDHLGRPYRPDILPDYTVAALDQLPALLDTL